MHSMAEALVQFSEIMLLVLDERHGSETVDIIVLSMTAISKMLVFIASC